MTRRTLAGRTGFTLPELLIALVIFSIVMAAALNFLRSTGRSVSLGNERGNASQNLEFAFATMEQRLRAAGADAPDQQPGLVYAGANVVAFNANYTTNVANDPFAVYYDPDAPTGAVSALTQAQKFTLPLTAFAYPNTTYVKAGINSSAETIIFYITRDSTVTSRTDLYMLMQQVNNLPPELVSRNIVGSPTTQFFQYYRLVIPVAANSYMDSVKVTKLPLTHSVPIHLGTADTAAAAVIDSIRIVRVMLTVTNGQTGTAERLRTLDRYIALPNAGLASHQTCGDTPLLGTGLTATEITQADGTPAVTLSWNAATDETGGQKSVVRYVIWRKLQTDPTWGTPYLSIPAGSPTYSYTDAAVAHGSTYVYQLAAEDCTPTMSTPTSSLAVTIP